MDEFTTVNDVQVSDEGSQIETTQVQDTGASEINSAPAEQKPVQDAQTNAMYANIRREAEQRAKDTVIAEMNYEYKGQPIKTYAQYQQVLREIEVEKQQEEMRNAGLDPNLVNQVVNQHPAVQWANQFKQQQEQQLQFNAEASELFGMFPDLKAEQIQPEVYNLKATKGLSLLDAYLRVNFKNMGTQAEQSAIKKITQNAQTSPGALGTGGEPQTNSIKDMSDTDFRKLQEAVLRGERKTL